MTNSSIDPARPDIAVLHITESIGAASGGVGPVVIGLSTEQRLHNCSPEIWCLDPSFEVPAISGKVKVFDKFGPRQIGYSPEMEKTIAASGSLFDIVHQHSLWRAISRVTVNYRKKFDRPTVVAPHGTLESYALKRSQSKKRIALFLYEMNNLQYASCLHATSASEAHSFRDFGLRNPIAVIPNGISDDILGKQGDGDRFRSRFAIDGDKRMFLFLSRINPKKGLPLLFTTISGMREELEGSVFVIAGFEDVPGYKAELQQMVSRLTISDMVIFVEPLFGPDKDDALSATDILVLPTHSEGFGMIVIDALAAGVPVITTYGAPWEELRSHNCGWWVEISEDGICGALRDAAGKSSDELLEMGTRGKALVMSKYTWSQISRMTIEMYNWLLGRRTTPDFVIRG